MISFMHLQHNYAQSMVLCIKYQPFFESATEPDRDRWYSHIRSPYERVFSQRQRRVRYVGTTKNQFSAFMEAICFNLKRICVLDPPGLILS